MSPLTPVKYKTPDGVERTLRFTFGAQRRIVERLGCQLGVAFQKYGESAMPEILYCCMYDKDGNPPEGLDPVRFSEEADPESTMEMLAALEASCPPGKIKNALRAGIQDAKEEEAEAAKKIAALRALQLKMLGSISGASPDSASDSQNPNSGSSPQENSTPSATDTTKSETSGAASQG